MSGTSSGRIGVSSVFVVVLVLLLPVLVTATEITLTPAGRQFQDRGGNVKLGPLTLDLGMMLQVGYDDNITLAAHNDDIQEGFFTETGLTTQANLSLDTLYLQVNSGLGVGYRSYSGSGGEDGWQVTGSGGRATAHIDMEFLLSETDTLTLAETFSRTIDNLELDNSRGSQPNAYIMTNTLALMYDKRLSELLTFKARLARVDVWWSEKFYEYLEHHKHSVDTVLLWRLNRDFQIGPYVRWQEVVYSKKMHNDSDSLGAGLAFVYQRPSGFTVDGSVGVENLDFDTSNYPTATDDGLDVTCRLGVTFATSEVTTHRISASRERTHGDIAHRFNYVEKHRLGYSIAVNIIKDLRLLGSADWVRSKESDGGETADIFRFGFSTGYQITRKTTAELRYERQQKHSDDDDREYARNLVTLTLTHSF